MRAAGGVSLYDDSLLIGGRGRGREERGAVQARGAAKCTRRIDVPSARGLQARKVIDVVRESAEWFGFDGKLGCVGKIEEWLFWRWGGESRTSRERRVCFGLSWVGFASAVCWEREVPGAGGDQASQPVTRSTAPEKEGLRGAGEPLCLGGGGRRCRGLEGVASAQCTLPGARLAPSDSTVASRPIAAPPSRLK